MHEVIVPEEVKYSELLRVGSLSPNNYKKLSIKNNNQTCIGSFLNESTPFIKGKEPGSSAYVKKSKQIFLRNSCINNIQYSVDKSKYIYLNPNYYEDSMVSTGDVLLCTDANIGDSCLFISDNEKVIFSSGVIKLQFKNEKEKYYVLRKARNDEANQIYFKILEEDDEGLYIRDIMRGGIKNDDPRIPRYIFE